MNSIKEYKIPENVFDEPVVEIVSDDDDSPCSNQKKEIDFNNLTETAVLYSSELMDMCPESHQNGVKSRIVEIVA
tara:strand:+ start:205 stop:429 length:225 start_codon:yes stop_codon:yes gene_type:complete